MNDEHSPQPPRDDAGIPAAPSPDASSPAASGPETSIPDAGTPGTAPLPPQAAPDPAPSWYGASGAGFSYGAATPHGADIAAAASALGAKACSLGVEQLPEALDEPEHGLRMLVVQESPSPVPRNS